MTGNCRLMILLVFQIYIDKAYMNEKDLGKVKS